MPLDIPRLRLESQQIARPRFETPAEVVAALGAVQAQDYPASLWAIGLRLPRATEADVEAAVAKGEVVRTWPMRGTLHFVAAADVRWLLSLCAHRGISAFQGRMRRLEIDDRALATARTLWTRALQGGKQLLRAELYALLERAGVSTSEQRGPHILGYLAQEGLVCIGPRRGRQHTVVLLDEWAPGALDLPREEALAELTLRYFSGHGPATAADFAWWSGLPMAMVKAGIEMAGSRLDRVTVDGKTYWLAPGALPATISRGTVHLLPAFDEYLVGYRERDAVLAPADRLRINAGGGLLNPAVLRDGRVIGAWRRSLVDGAAIIKPEPFAPFAAPLQRSLAAAADRYGRFLGVPATVSET
jgi:hypothetical protein